MPILRMRRFDLLRTDLGIFLDAKALRPRMRVRSDAARGRTGAPEVTRQLLRRVETATVSSDLTSDAETPSGCDVQGRDER